MASPGEGIAGVVAAAAERTAAAGTARLFAAWAQSPVPGEADRRCEGVADLSQRRARVWQVPMGTAGLAARVIEEHQGSGQDLAGLAEPQEMVYDGANTYLCAGGNWTGFFLGDRDGPRGVNDPLWPLDALLGTRDAAHTGAGEVRGAAVKRYRAVIDLGLADAALPAGVTVPAGPFRDLSRVPAEVWLDAAGLCRRIAVVTERAAAGNREPTWSVVELWDFGVQADIAAPSPDEILPPGQAYRSGPARSR